jgi:hypothetical protein
MAAPDPNALAHARRAEPSQLLRGKADPMGLAHARRAEPAAQLVPPAAAGGGGATPLRSFAVVVA